MSIQQAIDELASLCSQAATQSDVKEVARMAYMQANMTQAALSALVKMLSAGGYSGHLPADAWAKELESGYRTQLQQLIAAGTQIVMAPGGKSS